MKLRRKALIEGFTAVLWSEGRWTYFETAEDAVEYAENKNIGKPVVFDVRTQKRILT